jgi:hypothetical protein
MNMEISWLKFPSSAADNLVRYATLKQAPETIFPKERISGRPAVKHKSGIVRLITPV